MVTIETAHGFFRRVDVYYAQKLEDIDALKINLSPSKIVYIRQAPILFNLQQFSGWYRPFPTILLELERDIDELFREASSTCRNGVRRIERLARQVTLRRNDSAAYADFVELNNRFIARSRHAEPLSRSRLEDLRQNVDVFVAYFEGRPICGHVFIRDESIGRVALLLSASTRLDGTDSPAFVSWVNRWLHWREIQQYKSDGMLVYDFGGVGKDTPREAGIARFKESFGGTNVLEHNYIAAKPITLMGITLFYAMRRIRSLKSSFGIGGLFKKSGWTVIGRTPSSGSF